MKITVTQQHIDKGVRGSCSSDPISLALQDAGFKNPWAGTDRITASGFGPFRRYYSLETPPALLAFMRDFDTGKEVLPFEFELEV